MKVLITSGGTKIPIDSVRSITNKSNGTFGSQIAEKFISSCLLNDKVHFLMAKGSKIPFQNIDSTLYPCQKSYSYFNTFWDYERELFDYLHNIKPDIIILAAAVSDYGVKDPVNGKIRTEENLILQLSPLTKLIGKVREICKDAIICGFKLLVHSTRQGLIAAAKESIKTNQLDLVVANDFSTIRCKDHSLNIVEANWDAEFKRSEMDLAMIVRDFCMNHYYRKEK